jgi:hypothetical protein
LTRTAAEDFARRIREDLLRKRDEAASKADELQQQFELYPHDEIRKARDTAARLVDRYDQTIADISRRRK